MTGGTPTNSFAILAAETFQVARLAYQKNPTNDDAVWKFGRAAFDRAEFATNDTERATIAIEAIAICRQLTERSPKLSAAHYYLAMNLGQLARTKALGALRLVNEMEREFKQAAELDPLFDFAGSDRNLGLLYFEAPGWPASVGSRNKARTHLTKALELAPSYPENSLNWIEALTEWGEKTRARKELKSLDALLPKARETWKGPDWDSSWADWNHRIGKLHAKLAEKGK